MPLNQWKNWFYVKFLKTIRGQNIDLLSIFKSKKIDRKLDMNEIQTENSVCFPCSKIASREKKVFFFFSHNIIINRVSMIIYIFLFPSNTIITSTHFPSVSQHIHTQWFVFSFLISIFLGTMCTRHYRYCIFFLRFIHSQSHWNFVRYPRIRIL